LELGRSEGCGVEGSTQIEIQSGQQRYGGGFILDFEKKKSFLSESSVVDSSLGSDSGK